MLNHLHAIPERNGRTDIQTDRQICNINIARQTRDKNLTILNSVNLHNFVTKFCTVVTKLFDIISWKFLFKSVEI